VSVKAGGPSASVDKVEMDALRSTGRAIRRWLRWCLGAALFISLTNCAHQPDVQFAVRNFAELTGSPCPGSMYFCFEVSVQNVGTERGSGHCDLAYVDDPDPTGRRSQRRSWSP
jgi:hypothetical protein